MIRRMRYVFDQILQAAKQMGAEKDVRYTMMKTMMYESLKDLARIPDRIMVPMVREFAQALAFVADGSIEELEEVLAAQRDNSEES